MRRSGRKGYKRANRRDERKNVSSGLPGTNAARAALREGRDFTEPPPGRVTEREW